MHDDSSNNAHLSMASSLLENKNIPKRRKILVLGAPGVGKSAMIMRFKDDIFLDYYEPTIQSSYKKLLTFNNEHIELELMDIDGQTEYTIFSFSKFSYGIHGYILAYSIENRQSFELVKVINSKLTSVTGRDIPKILIANKCDLNSRREISNEEGKALAKTMNCPFLECSARTSDNINKMFHMILVEIKKFENNVDIKGLTCKKLFGFFVKHEKFLIKLFYILMGVHIFLGVLLIIYGFYLGITYISKNDVINSIF